jgi:chromosome segregation protein
VYIKSVELSHFKSFGGTTAVPLMSGFTVVSGPNGSGKSNILDALLFALGLSSSKGMRAERLPDLVNQSHSSRRTTAEATVTVTFDVSDIDPTLLIADADDDTPGAEDSNGHSEAQNGDGGSQNGTQNGNGKGEPGKANIVPLSLGPEWQVTRRLRVTPQGTYTSNYYINGESCTLTQLHEQLQRFRIYPEGYNVVLQGDVTSIISMNSRERRQIIDEMAGVGAFDRKIDQARQKLDAVKDREERFRIVEKELMAQRDRLAQDRLKAEKYQALKASLQVQLTWEKVLVWREQQTQVETLTAQIRTGEGQLEALAARSQITATEIQQATARLEELNQRVKALGEEEHLALQSTLATEEAELRQLQRQAQALEQARREGQAQLQQAQTDLQQTHQALVDLDGTAQALAGGELLRLQGECDRTQADLNTARSAVGDIAATSQAWVQQQTDLRRQVEQLLSTLEPQRAEQVRLNERHQQLQSQLDSQQATVDTLSQDIAAQTAAQPAVTQLAEAQAQVQTLAQAVASAEEDLTVQRQTQARLLQEQRDKQRQLDKLEAQAQAIQETQGTQATKVLINSGLEGVCGLVAQLGRVDPRYQLGLEIAAGGRLGYLVVETDRVAQAGIQLLKQRRAGRATFLPLNSIRVPKFTPISPWQRPEGFVDYAVNLIDCDPDYRDVFAYVFGSTVVFDSLDLARQHLGKFRIVTLDGELLETSGAMTGGSLGSRQGRLHFGTVEAGESAEAVALRQRLGEIERMLDRCDRTLATAAQTAKDRAAELIEARQRHRELELSGGQQQRQIQQLQQQLQQAQAQVQRYRQEADTAQARLSELRQTLPAQEAQLQTLRHQLNELETSQSHSEWRQAQTQVQQLETQLQTAQAALQSAQQQQQTLESQRQRLQEKIQQIQQQIQAQRQQQQEQINQQASLSQQQTDLQQRIDQTQAALDRLGQTLAAERAARDGAERHLRERQMTQQQTDWEQQKLQETQAERRQALEALQAQVGALAADLPEPLPDIPAETDLEQVRKSVRSHQRRLEALEPVNMLALEEYNRTQTRLEELSQKLSTLEEERTELLLRVETFTTLRRKAFQEAFDAVNENFQSIFAELSDGDGHLQLDDSQDPFNGGLNLVAHPKGKPVRRLASMSGGEKSLTALSFIFALQRYRPSPFYAFDEVDMFLDGANVERLAKMIKHQTQQAQFIVVSLRRPMIESAERTIGVTQARGAYTQVLGISLDPQPASV